MNIKADLIIKAGILVTCDESNRVLYDQDVFVSDGQIVGIAEQCPESGVQRTGKVIHCERHIVMPGFVNTHTHIPMAYFKGLADDLPLEEWLSDYIWKAEARYINPEFVYQASLHGIGEMLLAGITCFNDMYFLPMQTVKAVRESGIRAVIGDIVLDFPMGDFHLPENNLKLLPEYLQAVSDNDLIDFSIAPHSVYTCGTESWRVSVKCGMQNVGAHPDHRTPLLLHTHLCETAKEVADFRSTHNGQTPVEYLYELGAFEGKTVIAHGVYLSESDFRLLEGKDCSVSINLHSNLKLGSGIPPIREYLSHNINVSFGTDGVASNNTIDIAGEISTAAKLYKAIYNDPTFLPAKDLVKMATFGGAKALGKEDIIGSIEVGKAADIITIAIDNFQSHPVFDPFSHIVYGMNSNKVHNVLVNGKVLVEKGKLTTINEDTLLQYAKTHSALITQNSSLHKRG